MGSPRIAFAVVVAASLVPLAARADDCPPGSIFKNQDGFSWCEPTVCQTDGQCNPGEVCRPVPLCMQVGSLNLPSDRGVADAGKRLVVTQRCAPDKTCPQTTVCSDLGRCLSKSAAEKMGVLAAPAASGASAPAAEAKKSCGCRAVGLPSSAGASGLLAMGALALTVLRRRRS